MESFREFLIFSPDYCDLIAFVSTEDVNKSYTINVDWNYAVNSVKPKLFLQNDENDDEEEKNNQNGGKQEEKNRLQNMAVTESNSLLAFTANDKSLFIWNIDGGASAKILSRRSFFRSSSCIRFSKCGQLLFLADKTGDIFEYPCDKENINSRGRWIFGHLSQILDLQLTPDFRYMLTSDRDEKIRVTHYPKVHEIKTYCLGHTEFVSALAIISDSHLLSISGDKTLKLWTIDEGKELHSHPLSFVPVLLKTIVNSSHSGLICTSSTDHTVHIFKYTIDDSNMTLTLDELGEKQYQSDIEMSILSNDFYIEYTQQDSGGIFIDKIKIDDKIASFTRIFDNSSLSTDIKSATIFKSFDVNLLFKSSRMFDNVKQYIDRKKARIENKKAKK